MFLLFFFVGFLFCLVRIFRFILCGKVFDFSISFYFSCAEGAQGASVTGSL